MASQDFKTVLVKDSRIRDITDNLTYAVQSGASSNTYQRFSAVSTSKSNLVFNVQVPSESIVVSREVLIRTQIHFTVDVTDVPVGKLAFDYGNTDALQAFPLNSLFSNLSAQINNTNVSVNLQDVLPALLRMNNSRHLYRYNSMTPALPDQAYKFYSDAVLTNNNPLAGYTNASYDVDQLPRGAHQLKSCFLERLNAAGAYQDNSPVSTNVTDKFIIRCVVEVTEPLFLSPFIFGDSEYNKQGFVGLNALNLVCNIDTTCRRFFSTANSGYTYAVSLGTTDKSGGNPDPVPPGNANGFSNAELLMNFLTTQPTDLIAAKNIVPFHDFSRYLSRSDSSPTISPGATSKITSQNIQLNQLPDLFLIMARKPMTSQNVKDSSSFLPINSVSVNLNNVSGLLSSASRQDLWRISINNGCTMNWKEWSGYAYRPDNTTGTGQNVATTGSLLVLNPAKDLSLPSYLSCGSIGQFNFQIDVDVTNNGTGSLNPELCIITVNSGIFSTVAGTSSIYTGVLSKQMVLDAQAEPAEYTISSAEYYRQVGGAMLPASASKGMLRMPVDYAEGAGVKSAGAFSAAGMERKLDAMAM